MLMLEGPSRFLLELLRVETPVWHEMSLSMIIGLILFVVGVVLWLVLAQRPPFTDGTRREVGRMAGTPQPA